MYRHMFGPALLVVLAGTPLPCRAAVITYVANLDGPSESPANSSPGTGFAEVDYDNVAHTMRVRVNFTGLTGTTTASHIHAATLTPLSGTAGVATQTPSFTGLPLGVMSGSFDQTLDMTLSSTYNPSYVSANGGTPASAEAALTSAFANGTSYLNVHTSTFGGGEIRGFLVPVPEPSTLLLAGAGLGGLAWRRRRSGKARGAE